MIYKRGKIVIVNSIEPYASDSELTSLNLLFISKSLNRTFPLPNTIGFTISRNSSIKPSLSKDVLSSPSRQFSVQYSASS